MTLKHVQLLILAAFLSVATCISVNNQLETKKLNENVLIPRMIYRNIEWYTENEELKEKDFLYAFKNKRNVSCILANMSISITVPYINEKDEEKTQVLPVAPDASTTGSNCSDIISKMKLTWKADKDSNNKDNVITFIFLNDHTDFSLFSINTSIYLDKKNFPDAKADTKTLSEYTSEKDLRLFVTPVQNGFHRCTKDTPITVGKHKLIISNVTLIAFNSVEDISSRKETTCSDETNRTETFPYVLKDGERNCSLARMSISLNISYPTKDSKIGHGIISVPNNAKVSGKCGDSYSEMVLTWPVKSETASTFDSNTNQIVFHFLKNEGIASVMDIYFDIFLDENHFPNNNGGKISEQTPRNFNIFSAPGDNGVYSCANVTTVNFANSIMNISDVLLVAFNGQQDFSLKTVVDCKSQFTLSKENFNYVVSDENPDVGCILANMTITIEIPYNNTESKVVNKTIDVPSNLIVTGTCKSRLSEMTLSWPVLKNKEMMNTITFYVIKKENRSSVFLIDTNIYLDEDRFPGVLEKDKQISRESEINLDLFNAPANGLYNCTNVHTIRMNDIEMNITNVIFVAFNTAEDLSSNTVENCNSETDISSTTVSTTELTTELTTESTITNQPITESSPKPTPQPDPDPSVKEFNYYYMNPETKIVCTMANMTISMKVSYNTKNSGSQISKLDVPLKPEIGGKCDDASSTMELIWKETENTFDTVATENVVTLTFGKDDSKFFINEINVKLYMDEKNFPNSKNEKLEASAKKITLFSTPVKQLFRCTPETQVKVGDVEVTFSKVALIAFNTENKVTWKSEQNCVPEEEGSDVGAIVGGIIGCLLFIGLVAFGIIMYRKRRRMA